MRWLVLMAGLLLAGTATAQVLKHRYGPYDFLDASTGGVVFCSDDVFYYEGASSEEEFYKSKIKGNYPKSDFFGKVPYNLDKIVLSFEKISSKFTVSWVVKCDLKNKSILFKVHNSKNLENTTEYYYYFYGSKNVIDVSKVCNKYNCFSFPYISEGELKSILKRIEILERNTVGFEKIKGKLIEIAYKNGFLYFQSENAFFRMGRDFKKVKIIDSKEFIENESKTIGYFSFLSIDDDNRLSIYYILRDKTGFFDDKIVECTFSRSRVYICSDKNTRKASIHISNPGHILRIKNGYAATGFQTDCLYVYYKRVNKKIGCQYGPWDISVSPSRRKIGALKLVPDGSPREIYVRESFGSPYQYIEIWEFR